MGHDLEIPAINYYTFSFISILLFSCMVFGELYSA